MPGFSDIEPKEDQNECNSGAEPQGRRPAPGQVEQPAGNSRAGRCNQIPDRLCEPRDQRSLRSVFRMIDEEAHPETERSALAVSAQKDHKPDGGSPGSKDHEQESHGVGYSESDPEPGTVTPQFR